MFDQFDDMSLAMLASRFEQIARDKVASVRAASISSYRRGSFDINDMLGQIMEFTKTAMVSNPVTVRIVKVMSSGSGSPDIQGIMKIEHNLEGHRLSQMFGALPGTDPFREAMAENLPCAIPERGMFPLHSPEQALLSYLFARAQSVPEHFMRRFDEPMETMFGPISFRNMQNVIDVNPVEQVFDDSNYMDYTPEVDDGMPPVHTFLPKLIAALLKINLLTKGKLDNLMKDVSGKYKNEKYIVIADRDFQKNVLDGLNDLIGRDAVKAHTGRFPEELVFNTELDKSVPGILKVRNILIDTSKLNNMPYKDAVDSMSAQVADAIYNSEKTDINIKALVDLIERLEDLKVDDEAERKEINDRVLNPLKHFLQPDEYVVDKIMTVQ